MKHNYKLKSAVAVAASLIGLGMNQNAFALGLSDISLKSYLGQPLKASIKIYGASEVNGNNCFRLAANGSDISYVNFKMSPITADSATLTLTSNQVINEPILNLSVVSQCGAAFQRDYVLLLDPPLFATANEAVETHALVTGNPSTLVKTDNITKNEAPTSSAQLAPRKVAKQVKKSRKSKKNKSKQSVTTRKSASPSQRLTKTAEKKSPAAVTTNTARLTISGGSYSAANSIGLRLDRQLTSQPGDYIAAPLADADMQDEVVAMNNRLEHLKQQLAKLKANNQKLMIENESKTAALTEANSLRDTITNILGVLGGGLLMLGGYIGFNWLRKRQLIKQTNTIWTGKKEAADTAEAPQAAVQDNAEESLFFDDEPNKTEEPANEALGQTDDTHDEVLTNGDEAFEFNSSDNNAITFHEEDDTEGSVLDHADVFLSHGRTSLAIQLLQNHLLEHPKQSVTIWLFLLDLLAKEKLQTLYEETTVECKEHFNIKIAGFSEEEQTPSDQTLESYPRLKSGLEEVWGKPESIVYLDDLIYNNRLEQRAGLPESLIEDLMLLKKLAQESIDSAEVIELDEKKQKVLDEKEAALAAKKAKKIEQLQKAQEAEEKANKKSEELFEFELVEWK